MKILLLSNQVPMPNEKRIMRINTLYKMLVERKHDVTVLTSRFNHYDKKKREMDTSFDNFNVVLLNEPGYKKNISIKRIISQIIFGLNAKKWFKKHFKEFDCVYAVVPTYEASYAIGKICNKKSIPFILDVEDLWPEGMYVAFKKSIITKIIFSPIKRLANKTYKLANSITAVSDEYLARAKQCNKKSTNDTTVYLGVDSESFSDGLKENTIVNKPKGEFWICYIGTLSTNYDIETLILAMDKTKKMGYNDIKCKILGKGAKENKLIELAEGKKANVEFLGFYNYKKMVKYLAYCDLFVNPIQKNASGSIINKVGDYFASGKPVLNSCTNKEMMKLIDTYNTGYNYNPNDVEALTRLIIREYKEKDNRILQGKNGFKLYENKFNRQKSYTAIIKQLENTKIHTII